MNRIQERISNSAPAQKIASIFSLPIFWMLLGPPAIRTAVDDDRSGLSSLQGDQDIWNYIRLVWWLLFGTIALILIIRERRLLQQMLSEIGKPVAFVSLYLVGMFVSIVLSPVPMFTAANVVMMFLLIMATVHMALKIYGGVLPISRVLQYLLWTAVFLLLFVSAIYLMFPQLVSTGVFGARLRGEGFAYAPLLSVVSVYLGIHFFLLNKSRRRLLYVFPILFGFYWLMLGQTRSAYLGMAVGAFMMFWANGKLAKNVVNLTAVAVAGMIGLIGIGMLYGTSQRVTWYLDRNYERFIVRDYWALKDAEIQAKSLATLNGRTEAAAVLLNGVASHPLGLGYIGGVRSYMSRPDVLSTLPDKAFIGAHNGYLEVLGGAGIFALLGFVLWLGWVVMHAWRFKHVDALMVLGILFVLLVEGFFESEISLPFHQSAVLIWMMGGIVAASVAYDRRIRLRRPENLGPPRRFESEVVQQYD